MKLWERYIEELYIELKDKKRNISSLSNNEYMKRYSKRHHASNDWKNEPYESRKSYKYNHNNLDDKKKRNDVNDEIYTSSSSLCKKYNKHKKSKM